MAKRTDVEGLEGAIRRRPTIISDAKRVERVHLHLYLPKDLVDRLRLFQATHHEEFPRLSAVVARALAEFLEGRNG